MARTLKNVLAFFALVMVGISAGSCLAAADFLEEQLKRHSHKPGLHRAIL
jgi:hypothetical protein